METIEELPNGNLRILIPIKICNIRKRRAIVLLSPEIVHKALLGELKVSAKALTHKSIPADWEKQKKVVGQG